MGGYELFLRKQAATALAERPGVEGILAFVEAAQPAGSSEEENGWTALEEIAAAVDSAEGDVLASFTGSNAGYAYPNYSAIYSGISDQVHGKRLVEVQRNLQLGYAALDEIRAAGLLDQLDQLAAYRRAVHEFSLSANQPAIAVLLPSLGSARNLTRLKAARMHLAAEAGNREEFLAAFESGLAIARFCSHQFTLIEALVGDAITSLMHDRVQAAILRHPDTDWLDGIEAAIARQTAPLRPSYRFEGEVFMGLDTINWFFINPSRARFGRFSPQINGLLGGVGSDSPFVFRLGTYAENRDAYKAIFKPYVDVAGIDPASRPTLPALETDNLVLVDGLAPALDRTLQAMDRLAVTTRATTTMIALERHYSDLGTYPESLESLVPTYLTALPLDPWSGEPLRYRPTIPETAADTLGTTYLLYSVGSDLLDETHDLPPSPVRQSRPDDIVFSPAAH